MPFQSEMRQNPSVNTHIRYRNVIEKKIILGFVLVAFAGVTQVRAGENCDKKCEDNLDQAVSTVIGLGVAATTALGVSIWMTTRDKDDKSAYLQENNKSIRKAFALGHGDALEDVLKFYNISPSQREETIRALKANRVGLVDHLRPDRLTPERLHEADLYIQSVVRNKK